MLTEEPTGRETSTDPWAGWNPFDPGQRDSLHERLRSLRERDPVNESPLGLWRLTGYQDVVRLLRDVPAGVRTVDGHGYRDGYARQ